MASIGMDVPEQPGLHQLPGAQTLDAGGGLPSMPSQEDVGSRDQLGDEPQPVAGATLSEKLSFIKANKLAGNKPVYVSTGGNANGGGAIVRPATASSGTSSSTSQARWVQPSGPRKPGEGTENEEQGIISAEKQPEGGVQLRITLLAAGFIIGPAGATVREIMRVTGCDVKSWTDNTGKRSAPVGAPRRPCRVFIVEGEDDAVAAAIDIITAAVDRYKELCEGRCQGQSVPRVQKVLGVEFTYQPPPRNVVPFAASLKGNVTRAPSRGSELAGVRGAGGMLSMLPGYLVPVPGAYMSPGSPAGAGMPFPMYMPQLGSAGFESELGSDPSAAGMGATDMYGSGGAFDVAGSGGGALRGGAAAGQAASSWASLPNPYTYPAGVDPASMMAYMSIMMPPSSPAAARFPGLDPSSPMAMPFGMSLPSGSPMAAMPPGLPSAFPTPGTGASLRSSSSPKNPSGSMNPYLTATTSTASPLASGDEQAPAYIMGGMGGPAGGGGVGGAAGMSPYQQDPYAASMHQPHSARGKREPSAGGFGGGEVAYPAEQVYGTAQQGVFGPALALGPTPVSPYMAPPGMPMGCWYPPSPHGGMHMPMMMVPGPAMHAGAGMYGQQQGPGSGRRHGTGSPPRGSHISPTASSGGVMSPSRLNPKAQPWGSPGSSSARSTSGGGDPRNRTADAEHDAAVKAANAAIAGRMTADAVTSAPGGDKSSGNGVSASTGGDVHMVVPKVTIPLSQQHEPMSHDPPHLGLPLNYGKTPKRPSASGVPVMGGGTGAHRYVTASGADVLTLHGPGTDSSGTPMTVEYTPPGSSLGSGGGMHKTAGGMTMRGGSSSGAVGYGLGGLQPGDSPSLVSPEDPLVSPTRFGSRGARGMRRQKSQVGEGGSLPGSAGSVNTPPEALRELPGLVDKMTLGPGAGSPM